MSIATFRPRAAPWVVRPVMVTIAVYAAIRLLLDGVPIVSAYPFGVAMAIGIAAYILKIREVNRVLGIDVDEEGLIDRLHGVKLPFVEITRVQISIRSFVATKGASRARVVTVATASHAIEFGDLGSRFGAIADGVHNLPGAGAILAVLASRTHATALYPAGWTQGGDARSGADTDSVGPRNEAPVSNLLLMRGQNLWGLLALGFKVVPKLGATALKLLKVIKPGAAVVTVAAYSLVFSWKFAIAIVLLVGFHECGHVYAMWRSGIAVKGIYFVPFFGGVALGKERARTAREDAYIAINGPAWGTYQSLAIWGLFVATDRQWPVLGAVAAWGGLLNLFNLLPVLPLDGGRILHALAFARRSSATLITTSLLLGLLLAYVFQLELLVLMVLIGLGEFTAEHRRAAMLPAFALIGRQHNLDTAALQHFDALVGTAEPGAGRSAHRARRQHESEALVQMAKREPMTAVEVGKTIASYAVLIVFLLVLIWWGRSLEGGGDPWQLLQ